jgi:hypothetical protein
MIKKVIVWVFLVVFIDDILSTEANFSCDTVENNGKTGHEYINYYSSELTSVMRMITLFSQHINSSDFSSGDYYVHLLEFPCTNSSSYCAIEWKVTE